MKLTPALLSTLIEEPLGEVKEFKLIEKGIKHVDDISCCVNLRKLDLSKNLLKDKAQLTGIQHCESLTWLKLAFNEIESIDFLERLHNLLILNLSHNQLTRLTSQIAKCTQLKVLILNHNNFISVENLGTLTELNTLILSHNKISTPPRVHNLRCLTKLQLSHNLLREFPSIQMLENLKELSLNSNRITSIPAEIQYCRCLAIINIGNNFISRFEELEILNRLLRLRELILLGNPMCKENTYKEKVKAMLPRLKILDGVRFDGNRKRKDHTNEFEDPEQSTTTSEAQTFKKIRNFQNQTKDNGRFRNSQTAMPSAKVTDFSQLGSDNFLDPKKHIIF